MKKSTLKSGESPLKKIKSVKLPVKKIMFSSYKEDFVITDQEEKEGGFLGSYNDKMVSTYKQAY